MQGSEYQVSVLSSSHPYIFILKICRKREKPLRREERTEITRDRYTVHPPPPPPHAKDPPRGGGGGGGADGGCGLSRHFRYLKGQVNNEGSSTSVVFKGTEQQMALQYIS